MTSTYDASILLRPESFPGVIINSTGTSAPGIHRFHGIGSIWPSGRSGAIGPRRFISTPVLRCFAMSGLFIRAAFDAA